MKTDETLLSASLHVKVSWMKPSSHTAKHIFRHRAKPIVGPRVSVLYLKVGTSVGGFSQ